MKLDLSNKSNLNSNLNADNIYIIEAKTETNVKKNK